MPTGKRLTPLEEMIKESDGPQEYYENLLKAKISDLPWTREIPLDLTTKRCHEKRCLTCGSPHLENSMSGLQCKRCGIKTLVEIYGLTKEKAEIEHQDRLAKKETGIKFLEMLERKRAFKTTN